MLKTAYVICGWIGAGTSDDMYRPRVADEVGYCGDVTGQALPAGNLPSPNLVVVRVGELRSPKHDGMIDALKADDRFLVLEEWEGDAGPHNEHATLGQLRAWLAINEVDPGIANAIVSEKRTEQVRAICKGFERSKS